ncbi:MAG TPA: T9SS type A sorting domain-containing protein [Catalimonadaceae bacterium]|nr:T9SS type A sorting domain-containing protein [Catalimonadaceae bacterium]
MKRILSLLFLVPVFAFAQWSNNPGLPLRVCPTNSQQFGPWIFPDGAEGQILFWTDYRGGGGATNMKLFAQHLDAAGNRLFPDSGKLVVNHPSKKTDFSIARDESGNFWIAFSLTTVTRIDSIVIQRFEGNSLAPIWNGLKKVASINSSDFNVIYLESIRILPQGDSANLQYNVTWMGGSTAKFVNRVSSNGTIRFGNGKSFTGFNQNYGPSVSLMNDDGTMLLIQRNANSLGTGVTAWKFDKNLNLNWGPKSLTTGTPGLDGGFEVLPDGSGGLVMAYIRNSSSGDLMATRMDSSGNFVWTPNHKPICDYSSSQSTPDLLKVGNHFYCSWIDNRPPANNSDVFLQKIDLQGERLWNPNGRRVFRLNSYIPTPKILADSSGNIIITSFQSSTGFVAQKVMPDSTFAWPGYGMLICNSGTYQPFYGSYNLSPGANGNTFVAWKNGDQNSGQIYVAGLAENGVLISSNQSRLSDGEVVTFFPNPSLSGVFQVQLPDPSQKDISYVVYSNEGKEIRSGFWKSDEAQVLDLSQQPAGLYQVVIQKNGQLRPIRLLKQ